MIRKTVSSICALLLFAGSLFGQAKVTLPAEVKASPGRLVKITAETKNKVVRWLVCSESADLIPFPGDGKEAIFSSPYPGRYLVYAWTAEEDVPSEPAKCIVIVDSVSPVPPGPVPPGPTPPGPVPPGPVTGMKVLILEETADRSKLPPDQKEVLFHKGVRDYLDAKTPVGPDGKTHEWRIWDKDADASDEAKVWQELISRPHPTVPWIVITSDRGIVFEGVLPENPEKTLELLKRYGG